MRIDRERLVLAMLRADLNNNQLALRAGLSRATVSAVKQGKSCSIETARKLASVLGEDIFERGAK